MASTGKKPGTTAVQRARDVRATVANHAIEGFLPDEQDQANQAAYIAGTKTVQELLEDARAFALKAKSEQ